MKQMVQKSDKTRFYSLKENVLPVPDSLDRCPAVDRWLPLTLEYPDCDQSSAAGDSAQIGVVTLMAFQNVVGQH
jgi:hypothetical protein